MNERAHDLMVLLRSILSSLPGATALSLHASQSWAVLWIKVSSDDAVIALGEDLGLGEPEITTTTQGWRRRVRSQGEQSTLRIEVAGPTHRGQPPRDDAGEAS